MKLLLFAAVFSFPALAQTFFTTGQGSGMDAGAGPFAVATADFNRDGKQDIAVADYGSSSVTVLLGDGRGGFAPAPGSPFRAGLHTLSLVVADFNGDGIPDIATINSISGPDFIGQGAIVVLLVMEAVASSQFAELAS